MNKLSIEEKARRYDEAIEKGKQIQNTPYTAHWDTMKEVVEHLFPELKESEDERMMNQLHSWMKEFGGAEEYTEKVYQWIKGLIEKQGEHAKFCDSIQVGDKVTRNEDGVLVNLSQLKRVAKKDDKQGEQNHAWSESDERKMRYIENELSCLIADEREIESPLTERVKDLYSALYWLKSLKDRHTWKPSDGQMEALSIAMQGVNDPLFSLYQDLKKLKG